MSEIAASGSRGPLRTQNRAGWFWRTHVDSKRFAYLADPVCIASLALYVVNRFYWKPHQIGGWFTHGYLNDVLCLPLLLPIILRGQRLVGLRKHDGFPRWWEVEQHWLIFSIVFEIVLPRFPHAFATTADPWDVVAYLWGGLAAFMCWGGRWDAIRRHVMAFSRSFS